MSEPITLYDADGNEVTRYSPTIAHLEVAAGLLFTSRPVVDPDEGMPALDGMPQENEAPHAVLGKLVPVCDEHGEAITYRGLSSANTPHAILGNITAGGSDQYAGETLTAKRVGRPRKVTGGVL